MAMPEQIEKQQVNRTIIRNDCSIFFCHYYTVIVMVQVHMYMYYIYNIDNLEIKHNKTMYRCVVHHQHFGMTC